MSADHDRLRATLAEILPEQGHHVDSVVVAAPPEPGSPIPPEGRWHLDRGELVELVDEH